MKTLIVYGFLGSGKTTFIKYLLSNVLKDKRSVILENESGSVSIDGTYLRDGGCKVVDLPAGCICCSLRSELPLAIEGIRKENPDIVIIEPSGIASLEDILSIDTMKVDSTITLIDVQRYPILMKLNPDFYRRQFSLSKNLFLTKVDKVERDEFYRVKDELQSLFPASSILDYDTSLSIPQWSDLIFNFSSESLKAESEHHSHHHPAFDNCTFVLKYGVTHSLLNNFLEGLRESNLGIERMKALFSVDGVPSKIDYLRDEVSIAPLSHSSEASISFWWEAGTKQPNDVRTKLKMLIIKYLNKDGTLTLCD
jgi:G3E family GTPase